MIVFSDGKQIGRLMAKLIIDSVDWNSCCCNKGNEFCTLYTA